MEDVAVAEHKAPRRGPLVHQDSVIATIGSVTDANLVSLPGLGYLALNADVLSRTTSQAFDLTRIPSTRLYKSSTAQTNDAIIHTAAVVEDDDEISPDVDYTKHDLKKFLVMHGSQYAQDLIAGNGLVHSKESLESPLLDYAEKEYEQHAIDAFDELLKLMNDKKAPEAEVCSVSERIAAFIRSGVNRRHIRNEIYVQLIKQLTNNPSPTSVIEGWNLLSFVCASFPPEGDLIKPVLGYLQSTTQGERSELCLMRIFRILETGARKNPPSKSEYTSLLSKKKMVIKVVLSDKYVTYFIFVISVLHGQYLLIMLRQ